MASSIQPPYQPEIRSQQGPDRACDEDRARGDQQRDTRAEQQAGIDVATDVVGAQQMIAFGAEDGGRGMPGAQLAMGCGVRGEPGRGDRREQDERQHGD